MGIPENKRKGFSKLWAKLENKTEKHLNKNNILAYLKRHEGKEMKFIRFAKNFLSLLKTLFK